MASRRSKEKAAKLRGSPTLFNMWKLVSFQKKLKRNPLGYLMVGTATIETGVDVLDTCVFVSAGAAVSVDGTNVKVAVKVGSNVDVFVKPTVGSKVSVAMAEGGIDVCDGGTSVSVERGVEVPVEVDGTLANKNPF